MLLITNENSHLGPITNNSCYSRFNLADIYFDLITKNNKVDEVYSDNFFPCADMLLLKRKL